MKQQPVLAGRLDQRVVKRQTAEALDLAYQYELSDDERHELVGVSTVDTWIQQGFDEWTAMLRIVPSRNGNPVVAEIRVFPKEPDALRRDAGLRPDEWCGCFTGIRAPVPGIGLTARLLRGVQIGEAVRDARIHFREMFDAGKMPPGSEIVVWDNRPASREKRAGRPRIPDAALVRLAAAYSKKVVRNPVEVAARACRISTSRARDWIHIARKRGFLAPADGTRPWGALTPEGEQVLAAMKAKAIESAQARVQKKGGRNL